jgi:long-chain fatty acid transport protein
MKIHINTIITTFTLALFSSSTFATNGSQPIATGALAKGMAGAGIALPQNSFIATYNPAGITEIGTMLDASMAVFAPTRSYRSSSEKLDPINQENESKNPLFFIPSFAVNKEINEKMNVAFAMYAKAGGSVVYKETGTYRKFNVSGNTSGKGVWTTAQLEQMLMSGTIAYKATPNHSLGISPLIGVQRFKATGLGYFQQVSADPNNLSDNGFDYSLGYGAMVGWHGNFGRYLSAAASYQSKVKMQKFEKYSGLFANGGELDMAPQWEVGIALRPTDNLSFAIDYQRIQYSKIPALNNPHNQELVISSGAEGFLSTVGTEGGAGFGWEDVSVFKLGVQWKAVKRHTFRAGYSHGNSPIASEDVFFNILAPAINEDHYSLGYTYDYSRKYKFDLAYVRTAANTVSGNNPNNFIDEGIELAMDQHQAEFGLSVIY